MTINTQKLREAAQAVIDDLGTDWYYASDWNRPGKDLLPDCDVRHIVEASPAAVIDLLDIVDAANEQVAEYARIAEQTRAEADARIEAQAAEIARLRGLVAEMAEHDTYETEYDGRMYSICHGCGAQDGEPHRDPNCLYVRAAKEQS